MRSRLGLLSLVVPLCAAACIVTTAAAKVDVKIGASQEGSEPSLQEIVDARYGAGAINVTTDYLGAHVGDPDPWFWVDNHFSALLVKGLWRNAHRNRIGWYRELETGAPAIDGVDDGVLFDGSDQAGDVALVMFSTPMTKFGFWMNPRGPLDALNAPEPELLWTNRHYNDVGPSGTGALHAPYDGDVQALVFDVSAWTAENTWLVCFEDVDSGAMPEACCGTDNDYNDAVFEITAFGATPTRPASLGQLKARYRR